MRGVDTRIVDARHAAPRAPAGSLTLGHNFFLSLFSSPSPWSARPVLFAWRAVPGIRTGGL
jgi:hypothetical protein